MVTDVQDAVNHGVVEGHWRTLVMAWQAQNDGNIVRPWSAETLSPLREPSS